MNVSGVPEGVGHAHHLLLVLGVLDVRVGEVDERALDGVALLAVHEHVRPPHHLPTIVLLANNNKLLFYYCSLNNFLS